MQMPDMIDFPRFDHKDEYPFTEDFHIDLVNHCIGKNRLLGEYYGSLFSDLYGLDNIESKIVTRLCINLRSYIVIDDYIIDQNVIWFENQHYLFLEEWLGEIEEQICFTIRALDSNSLIWEKYKEGYNIGKIKFDAGKPYEAVIQKCCFLLLPFELFSGYPPKFSVNCCQRFIKDYLFSLQLLDDWADFDEDIEAGNENNLLHIGLSIDGRNLARSLLTPLCIEIIAQIIYTLKQVRSDSIPSICESFRLGMLEWCESILVLVGVPTSNIAEPRHKRKLSEFQSIDWNAVGREYSKFGDQIGSRIRDLICAEHAHKRIEVSAGSKRIVNWGGYGRQH